MSALSADWARFSREACGTKAHIVYDPDADWLLHLVLTPARVNDIVPAKLMPIEPGATYVFDLGTCDYSFWAKLDAVGCRFVTRLKKNTRLTMLAENEAAEGSTILCERIGLSRPPEWPGAARTLPEPGPRGLVRIESGKVLRIVELRPRCPG